jgi:hypothetical protein
MRFQSVEPSGITIPHEVTPMLAFCGAMTVVLCCVQRAKSGKTQEFSIARSQIKSLEDILTLFQELRTSDH